MKKPTPMVHGKTLDDWIARYPLIATLIRGESATWFNPAIAPLEAASADIDLDASDIADADARLRRFAPYLAHAFPDVRDTGGIIESPLHRADAFAAHIAGRYGVSVPANVLLKLDSQLPISGSVKARGGIYEVLFHAEQLAIDAGLLRLDDDYRVLAGDACRALFRRHKIAVGSTGNLGMSIGIAAARLGFQATVHMSEDARQWKKDRLRADGVTVVQHGGDYGQAVLQGRDEAGRDPLCHFVDDENSRTLFLGYAVAGQRLKHQFDQAGIRIDAQTPLFVYLPCGVGGGPGGISFGLKHAFGDNVHCIFAEPTQSPCMLLGVYTGLHDRIAVQDFAISNRTAADGLAVGRPSGFVGRSLARMIDGYYTLPDEEMYALLNIAWQSENVALEPSALAGAPGFARVMTEQQGYRERLGLTAKIVRNAWHVMWATGGGMVPKTEFEQYVRKGSCEQV